MRRAGHPPRYSKGRRQGGCVCLAEKVWRGDMCWCLESPYSVVSVSTTFMKVLVSSYLSPSHVNWQDAVGSRDRSHLLPVPPHTGANLSKSKVGTGGSGARTRLLPCLIWPIMRPSLGILNLEFGMRGAHVINMSGTF